MGGQKTSSGPTQSGKILQGALTEGLFPGASEHLVGTQKQGALLGGQQTAGYFDTLNQTANSPGFFSGIGDESNPFSTAWNSLNAGFDSNNSAIGPIQAGTASGATATAGQIADVAPVITQDSIAQAQDKLLNPPSVFDVMSGGPIVDAINARVDASSAAYTEQQLQKMTDAQERAYVNLVAGGGFVSSTAVQNAMDRITRDVMNDIAVFDATNSLEATKYLGTLAMQDIQNGTNGATVVLTQALVQRNQDVQSAIAQAELITQAAIASAQNATQASIASANNTTSANIANAQVQLGQQQLAQQGQLGLLGLGANDFQFNKGLQYDAANKPIDIAAGLAVGSNVSSGKAKSF